MPSRLPLCSAAPRSLPGGPPHASLPPLPPLLEHRTGRRSSVPAAATREPNRCRPFRLPAGLGGSTSLTRIARAHVATAHRAHPLSPPLASSSPSPRSAAQARTTHTQAAPRRSPSRRLQRGRPTCLSIIYAFPRPPPSAFPIQPSTAIAGHRGRLKKAALPRKGKNKQPPPHRGRQGIARQPPSGGGERQGGSKSFDKKERRRRGVPSEPKQLPPTTSLPSPPMPASRS